jgi:hypothetical protein
VVKEDETMLKFKHGRWASAFSVVACAGALLLGGAPAHAGAPPHTSTPSAHRDVPTPGGTSAFSHHAREFLAGQRRLATAGISCWRDVTIYANANRRYVSAEMGYSGDFYRMLRARATAVGSWEKYIVCRDNSSGSTIMASQDAERYVSAELGYGGGFYGTLRARATIVGPWELFHTSGPPDGRWTYLYADGNGRYVSAEIGYSGNDNGMLRARATTVDAWELFYWSGTAWH